MEKALKTKIGKQINHLSSLLQDKLGLLAKQCAPDWGETSQINGHLETLMSRCPDCQLVYAMDSNGLQLSGNITRSGFFEDVRGQNLSQRPYFKALQPGQSFILSPVYISRSTHASTVTALHKVINSSGSILGYVAADFTLKGLPSLNLVMESPTDWRQIKGDPAIRGGLFNQQRVTSAMDDQLDAVTDILVELMSERGIFHTKLHYSSARATLWHYDNPHYYQLHVLDEIIDPAVCLAYPKCLYPPDAIVETKVIKRIWKRCIDLRNADSNIYLRSSSLNIINGIVGLTFSCDGSHYMPFREFLSKPDSFWFGIDTACGI